MLIPVLTLYPKNDGYLEVFTFFLLSDLLLMTLRNNS